MSLFYARGENPLALPAGDEPADAYGDEEDGCYSDLRKAIDGALVSILCWTGAWYRLRSPWRSFCMHKAIDGALVYQLEMNPPMRMGT